MTQDPNETQNTAQPQHTVDGPASTGSNQQRVHLDETDMTVDYANAFRTVTSPEDLMIDFGVNVIMQAEQGQIKAGEVHFKTNRRMIMNYYTAKRLAMTLNQTIMKYESAFGPLELDPEKRSIK